MKPPPDPEALLDVLLKSARQPSPPGAAAAPGVAARIAAQWAAGGRPANLAARLWERMAWQAALGGVAAALVVGVMLGDSWPGRAGGARNESALALEIVQLEELIWTP